VILAQLQVDGGGPLAGLRLSLAPLAGGAPRRLVVVLGGEGVGKTALLSAIATTRPGHATAQTTMLAPSAAPAARADDASRGAASEPMAVLADWALGDDDPTRPHALRVAGPNVKPPGERDEITLARRREQALFERRAAVGGFVAVTFSGARWFSRTAVVLTAPERGVLRHDPRASSSFDDATRADLTRDVKQALAFAGASAALAAAHPSPDHVRLVALDRALREVLAVLLEDTGATYVGTSPRTLEPTFDLGDRRVDLDDLPRSARHRVAFGVLTLRALSAGYPEHPDPREAEGVALIDDLELHQDARTVGALPGLLRRALPRVQWIVTTASHLVAAGCEVGDVLALRRVPDASEGGARLALHQGADAIVH
jgi:hypothetical protein